MNGNLKQERAAYSVSMKHFPVRDGARIACHVFEPKGDSRAVLVFLHGAALNSRLYAPIGVRLSSIFSIRAVFIDMRGHGESEGRRGHVAYSGQLEDDLHDILSLLRLESPGLPLFLGAHCIGSSVIVRYAGLKEVIPPEGYVFVSSLLIESPLPGMNGKQKKEVYAGAHDVVSKFHLKRLILLDYLNRLGLTAFNSLPIVHFRFPQDIERRAQNKVESYSYTMIRQMDFQRYYYGFGSLDKPLIMMIGQEDEMVPAEDLKRVFDRYVPTGIDKTFKFLPGCGHFNVVWGAGREIGQWITTRLGDLTC